MNRVLTEVLIFTVPTVAVRQAPVEEREKKRRITNMLPNSSDPTGRTLLFLVVQPVSVIYTLSFNTV